MAWVGSPFVNHKLDELNEPKDRVARPDPTGRE